MYKYFFKRALDIIAAVIILTIASPILLIVGVTLSFANNGDIFFIQKRPGKDEVIFKIIEV